MLEKIKSRYYKYGVLIAGFGDETNMALKAMANHDAKKVKGIMYKICTITVPKLYKTIGNVIVFKAKNREEAIKITEDYISFSNGFYLSKNV